MTTPAFPPPRHKRNNSTGSLPSIGMCSFGSFNFDGHDSVFRGGSGGGGDGDDSIVSEFERMFGGGSNNNKSSSSVTGSTSGMTASTMAHLPLILPSPKHGENSGPLRRRLHAVDTLNLPPCTPGSSAAASNRSRYSAATTATTTRSSSGTSSSGGSSSSKALMTPSTPSQIGEIIFGGGGMGAASPAPSQVTLSTIGTNGTPVSRSTMRDLLDTLNSLEGGGGDDVSSFGGSIGQSTITSKFQSPAAAPRSSAKSTSSSSSSSAASSRPPRALNIPSRNIRSSQRNSIVGAPPSGIPRPVSASTTSAGSMPPIRHKRETRAHHVLGGDTSGPPHVSRNKNGTTSKSRGKVSSTKGFQIPTIAQEVEADTQVATRAPPQSVLAENDRKENANAGVHVSKLPPMKGRSKPKTQGKQKQSGAFPTTFGGSTMALNTNENVVMPTKTSAKSHSRVKSTKIYTATRSSNQQMAQKLPSLHSSASLPQTNQRQHPDAVLPGSRRNYVGGNAHTGTAGTLAEF